MTAGILYRGDVHALTNKCIAGKFDRIPKMSCALELAQCGFPLVRVLRSSFTTSIPREHDLEPGLAPQVPGTDIEIRLGPDIRLRPPRKVFRLMEQHICKLVSKEQLRVY